MTNEQFEQIKKQIEEDLQIKDDEQVLNKSLNIPRIYHHFLDIYIREFNILKDIIVRKNIKFRELYHHYKFESQYDLSTKSEVESYICGDPLYVVIEKEHNNQESIVKFLEYSLKNIQGITYNIKNYMEMRKFLMGS